MKKLRDTPNKLLIYNHGAVCQAAARYDSRALRVHPEHGVGLDVQDRAHDLVRVGLAAVDIVALAQEAAVAEVHHLLGPSNRQENVFLFFVRQLRQWGAMLQNAAAVEQLGRFFYDVRELLRPYGIIFASCQRRNPRGALHEHLVVSSDYVGQRVRLARGIDEVYCAREDVKQSRYGVGRWLVDYCNGVGGAASEYVIARRLEAGQERPTDAIYFALEVASVASHRIGCIKANLYETGVGDGAMVPLSQHAAAALAHHQPRALDSEKYMPVQLVGHVPQAFL